MIKVAWLHDHSLSEVPTGGAERTNQLVVSQAPKNIKVDVMNPYHLKEKKQLKSYDLIITNNIKFFNRTQIEWMLECPRVRYEHDYWNLADEGHAQYQKEMWEGCMKMVFLSPAHYYEYRRLHPNIEFKNILFQPSPIEQDRFHSNRKEKICIYIGAMDIHKGIIDVLEWGEKRSIPIYAYGMGKLCEEVAEHEWGHYMGVVTYERVQKIMGKADIFIHLPVWVEPFGRTVMEARFAGCRIVTNNRLGAKSYDWWDEDIEDLRPMLEKQGKVFWKRLDLS